MRGKYILERLYIKLFGMNKYLLKKGVVMGDNPHVYSNISTTESYLIRLGDNVTISNDVQFITHDNSISKVIQGVSDVFGEINIGSNCFIGAHSIVLYGVSLAKGTIVAAGSVVTKSVTEEGIIIGGNPAKKIGTTEEFAMRMQEVAINISGLSDKEKKRKIMSSSKLIRNAL